MDKNKKKEIIARLDERGVRLPCPRCGYNSFAIFDGYFKQSIQDELMTGLVVGGPSIPSIITACNRCGFMAQHALGALDLLPQKAKEGKND